MTFRNDVQRGLACAVLTQGVPRGPYWSPDSTGTPRPTDAACRVLVAVLVERGRDRVELEDAFGVSAEERHPLSSSERTLVLLAWDLWATGHDAVRGADLLYSLDRANLTMVAGLLAAIAAPGAHELDAWISNHARSDS